MYSSRPFSWFNTTSFFSRCYCRYSTLSHLIYFYMWKGKKRKKSSYFSVQQNTWNSSCIWNHLPTTMPGFSLVDIVMGNRNEFLQPEVWRRYIHWIVFYVGNKTKWLKQPPSKWNKPQCWISSEFVELPTPESQTLALSRNSLCLGSVV